MASTETTPANKLWIAVSPNVRSKVRGRAGLAFERDAFTPVSVDLEASDEDIKARQKAGEYVVNAEGYSAIVNDDVGRFPHAGLIVRTTPPPQPPPVLEVERTRVMITTPALWREFAADRNVKLPIDRAHAEIAMGNPPHRITRGGERVDRVGSGLLGMPPNEFALWPQRGIWIEFGLRLNAKPDRADNETSRLRHALSGAIPMRAGDASLFGKPEPLPAPCRQRWSSSDHLPAWMLTIAGMLGIAPPRRFDRTPFQRELEQLEQWEVNAGHAIQEPQPVRPHGGLFDGTPRAPEIASVDQQRRELEQQVADARSEIEARSRSEFDAWSEEMDRVRLAVLASLDQALATTTDPLAAFALEQLARSGRGLPFSPALNEKDSLTAILSSGVGLEPAPEPKIAKRDRRLFVATARGIKVRGRAGLVFTAEGGEYLVDEQTERLIRADDGLVVFNSQQDITARINAATSEEIEAELAKRKAAREALEAKKARRDANPDRIKSGRKAAATVPEPEDTDGGDK